MHRGLSALFLGVNTEAMAQLKYFAIAGYVLPLSAVERPSRRTVELYWAIVAMLGPERHFLEADCSRTLDGSRKKRPPSTDTPPRRMYVERADFPYGGTSILVCRGANADEAYDFFRDLRYQNIRTRIRMPIVGSRQACECRRRQDVAPSRTSSLGMDLSHVLPVVATTRPNRQWHASRLPEGLVRLSMRPHFKGAPYPPLPSFRRTRVWA